MSYLQSSIVSVFPSTARTFSVTGKLTSEDNLTGIIRNLSDKDSFVISNDGKEFIIHGYYFKLNSLPEGEHLWARIKLDTIGRLCNVSDESITLDVPDGTTSNFYGLDIDTGVNPGWEETSNNFILHIKENGQIINKSFINSERIYSIIGENEVNLNSILDFKQDKLPNATAEGQILKSTNTVGGVTWGSPTTGVTQITAGDGLSGGTITSTGTIAVNFDTVQSKLSDNQMAAVNSGITSAKVTKYDGYESAISGKSSVSGTASGSNWTKITIDGTAKNIPSQITYSGGNAINITNKVVGLKINDGDQAHENIKLTMSSSKPDDSEGSVGDIWFKY